MSDNEQTANHPFRVHAIAVAEKSQEILRLLREINEIGNVPEAPPGLIPEFVVSQSFAVMHLNLAMYAHMYGAGKAEATLAEFVKAQDEAPDDDRR